MIQGKFAHEGELQHKIIVDICANLKKWSQNNNLIHNNDYGDFCGQIAERSYQFNKKLYKNHEATEALRKNHKKNKDKSHLKDLVTIVTDAKSLLTKIEENPLLHSRDSINTVKPENHNGYKEYPFSPPWESALVHFNLLKNHNNMKDINQWLFDNFPIPNREQESRLEKTLHLSSNIRELMLHVSLIFEKEKEITKEQILNLKHEASREIQDLPNILEKTKEKAFKKFSSNSNLSLDDIKETLLDEMKFISDKAIQGIDASTDKYLVYQRENKSKIELEYIADLANTFKHFTKRSNLKRTAEEIAQKKTTPFRELISICFNTLDENITDETINDRLKSLKKHRGKKEI